MIRLEDVLSIEQLNFIIGTYDPYFYAYSLNDGTQIKTEIQKVYTSLGTEEEFKSMRLFDLILKNYKTPELDGGDEFLKSLYDVLRKNESRIDAEKFLLILAKKAFGAIRCLEEGTEFVFLHRHAWGVDEKKELLTPEKLRELKALFAEGVILANSKLKESRRTGKPLEIKKTIAFEGHNETIDYSIKDLKQDAKSELVLTNLDYSKLSEYIKKKWLRKHEIIDAMKKNSIPKEMTIDIMAQGVIKQEEILKEVFKVKSLEELLNSDKLSMIDRLQLYSAGLIGVEDLEKYLEAHPVTEMPTKESYKQIAKYYKGNIKRLSELLTHNVLDYISSIAFLNYLLELGYISEKEKEYLIKLMSDFKVNQLDAKEPTGQSIIINTGMSLTHSSRLTIEPQFRADYLISIGQVKQILVNGSGFIKDDTENSIQNSDEKTKGKKQKNSLDGYQLIIVPEKGVAILEKFYEVTRDKEGNIVYKKDKEGKVIPAIENATYIIPIGMAKEFVETKNKQQLIKNPFVARVPHTGNWVVSVEKGIRTVCERVGMTVSFDKENTDIWNQKIKENYEQLLEYR